MHSECLYFKSIMDNPSTVKIYTFERDDFFINVDTTGLSINLVTDYLVHSFIGYVLLLFSCL